ncbi:MAG TPA: hypothetical protein VFX57_07830, partial [Sulfuricurvum sp.]|nr:hypothetical protein [Sulfuricurvum sp.]
IGQWLRVAKARGDVAESDPAMLYLMVELYRKMDRLEQLMTQSAPKQLNLTQDAAIGRIGLEHFELTIPLLQEGDRYYGRIEVPVYPRREIPLYFEAVSATLAKIIRIHSRDENEWGAYMRTRERAMIRHLKGNV